MREIIGYNLIDCKTGKVIQAYKANQAAIARKRADKLDNEYGAYRYAAQPIFSN